MTMTLPSNLRHLRKKKKLTQVAFSRKIQIELKRYAKWEEGRAEPDIASLITLSKVHHVSIDRMLKCDLSVQPHFT